MVFHSPCLSHVQFVLYSEPPLGDLMEILRFYSLNTKLINGSGIKEGFTFWLPFHCKSNYTICFSVNGVDPQANLCLIP